MFRRAAGRRAGHELGIRMLRRQDGRVGAGVLPKRGAAAEGVECVRARRRKCACRERDAARRRRRIDRPARSAASVGESVHVSGIGALDHMVGGGAAVREAGHEMDIGDLPTQVRPAAESRQTAGLPEGSGRHPNRGRRPDEPHAPYHPREAKTQIGRPPLPTASIGKSASGKTGGTRVTTMARRKRRGLRRVIMCLSDAAWAGSPWTDPLPLPAQGARRSRRPGCTRNMTGPVWNRPHGKREERET